MKVSVRPIGLLLAVAAALALSYLGHTVLFEQWRMQQERQLQRAKLLEEVLRLQRVVMDVETNFRGYLLAEQPSYLEPINQAEARLESGIDRLTLLTVESPGLQPGIRVLAARLREFIDSKRKLAALVGTDQQEQVRLYVRGGSGRALFLTIEKASGDFELRIERELPAEPLTYDAWIGRARWQLLLLELLAVGVAVSCTRALGLVRRPLVERSARVQV
ncbi:hypothetical protein FBQ96_16690 [Nitrospirales bacterium NOB]|nr:hypothetical protein [Nitrospirales bacterium NOB]